MVRYWGQCRLEPGVHPGVHSCQVFFTECDARHTDAVRHGARRGDGPQARSTSCSICAILFATVDCSGYGAHVVAGRKLYQSSYNRGCIARYGACGWSGPQVRPRARNSHRAAESNERSPDCHRALGVTGRPLDPHHRTSERISTQTTTQTTGRTACLTQTTERTSERSYPHCGETTPALAEAGEATKRMTIVYLGMT